MTYYYGFTALLTFSFLFGTIFIKNNHTITENILFSVILSLWSTWIILLIVIIFGHNISQLHLILLTLFLLIINFIKKNTIKKPNISSFIFYNTFCLIAFAIIFVFKSKFIPVFVHGDALFSWNRWAWELYNQKFISSGGYPIFWPNFWSLIYSSMGQFNNWIIPVISQIILPIILIVSNFLYYEKKYINFFYLNIFFSFSLIYILADRLFIGYMDAPLTILTYLSLSLLFLYQLSKKLNILLLASFVIAIASITKQQGFILPVFFFIFSFFHLIKKNINFKNFLFYNFISFFYVVTYFLFFENIDLTNIILNIFTGNYGNMSYLQSLSKEHISLNNSILYSFDTLTYRTTTYPILFLLFLGSLNFLLLFKKKEEGFFGMLCLIFTFLGFYFFMKYGSYDDRNGWFIFPYIIFSSMCIFYNNKKFSKIKFIESFSNKVKFEVFHIGKFFILLYFSTLLILLITERIVNFNYWQKYIQTNFGNTKELSIVGKKFLNNNGACSKIITNWNILPYNYNLMPYSLNLNKESNFENRIIVLSSDSGITNFLDQNKSCDKPDLWLLTQPFKKSSQPKKKLLIKNKKLVEISNLAYVKKK